MSQHRDHVEQKGSQIVHIRGDSDSDLEALFKAVMNPTDTHVPLTVPMRLRKLPNSFFKPPDTGSKTSPQSVSHSRESSADSTSSPFAASPAAGAAPQQQQPAQQTTGQGSPSQTAPAPAPPVQTASGLPIHHPRAHSSPASLQQNLAAATSQHLRTQSYEIQDDVPLPPGWEMAKTPQGQRYFLNHITQTTTWEDPRRKISLSAINLHTPSSGSSPSPPMNPLSPQNLGPLPENWEQATTQEGEVYFINHQARTTSWFDPRIPMHLQRPAVLLQAQQNQAPSINAATSQQSQQSTGSTQPTNNNQMNLQQHQQRVRLQRLQMERERLRLRQQEIMRQLKGSSGNSLCQQQNFVNSSGLPSYMDREQQRVDSPEPMNQDMLIRQTLNEGITSSPTTELPPVSTTGIDPFLGGSDFHSRQESTDSGLGMGTNYSLPHTPEDFLSNIDDSMDPESQDGNPPTQQTPSGDLGSLDLQNTDIANLGESNMDSDDLEPSLQEELSSDLLNDVEALLNSNRMDNVLTWL